MEKLHARLDEVVNYITPLLKLANSHMVNFFTNQLWESYIPNEVKLEIENGNERDVLDLLLSLEERKGISDGYRDIKQFILEAEKMSNVDDGITLNVASMNEKLKSAGKSYHPLQYREFMSPKKSHEVEVMSCLIANLASVTNASHLIDVGGGKGYLSSILAFEYKMKVLGLDSSQIKTSGAKSRVNKLKKVWVGTRKKIENSKSNPENEGSDGYSTEISGDLYRQETEYVSLSTDLLKITIEAFPRDKDFNCGLIGLHTCGDLAAVCLKQFLKYPDNMKFLVNVGCCHHLLSEGLDSFDSCGFPLSAFLREKKFSLGRNARMLSLQAQTRIQSSKCVPSESLFYRAVLQKLLIDKLGSDNIPQGQVGRVADKCNGFVEYVHKALEKLSLTHIKVTDSEAEEYYAHHERLKPQLMIFFMLRVVLAPVLENLILLDRLLYLEEQGIQHSYIVKMFDPVLSPRCYGIVALRDEIVLS